ncbi:MAG: chromosome partitioning protein ParB [Acidiphilium sp. 37-64-53]|uniref:ParB/RepB/Spo0J family partition protein n=1 Tax=Acidiphilium TaxID=522 RepID=UPI000BCF7AC4|nr:MULTISPECIES: ParB/RepB/Spo0J family partition protein [Acidiphilium]MBW4035924.1 ParB/RepB/Spo0J family partition protein [Pseudomonadota bacterium]OYW02789.1 MAG: chromosome partitioning protein ParB [Acidiphilium sp. 37-64-53]HQT84760.1 ParB/RepB/Spo0J family partition protein [Acidiphilium rubrum]
MGLKEQPRRLGKGLAALMGDTTMDAGIGPTEGARHLAIASLHPGPFQPRRAMDEDALEELAASLKSRGVLQPLLVRSFPGQAGQYQIIAGERRWRAAQRAGLHEVPVLVRELSDTDAMAAGLVENLQRQDLDPIEEAEGYQRLLDEFGMIQEDLATAVAKSRPHITNMLRLLNLPSDVQASLRSGDLSSGHARALMQHPDPQAGARTIIANRLTVRQAEAMVAAALTPKPAPPAPLAPDVNSVTRMLERELIEILGLRVRIRFNGKSGSVNLAYENLGQLDGILALLRGHQ